VGDIQGGGDGSRGGGVDSVSEDGRGVRDGGIGGGGVGDGIGFGDGGGGGGDADADAVGVTERRAPGMSTVRRDSLDGLEDEFHDATLEDQN